MRNGGDSSTVTRKVCCKNMKRTLWKRRQELKNYTDNGREMAWGEGLLFLYPRGRKGGVWLGGGEGVKLEGNSIVMRLRLRPYFFCWGRLTIQNRPSEEKFTIIRWHVRGMKPEVYWVKGKHCDRVFVSTDFNAGPKGGLRR